MKIILIQSFILILLFTGCAMSNKNLHNQSNSQKPGLFQRINNYVKNILPAKHQKQQNKNQEKEENRIQQSKKQEIQIKDNINSTGNKVDQVTKSVINPNKKNDEQKNLQELSLKMKNYLDESNVKVLSYKNLPILYINLGPIVHFETGKYNIKEQYKAKLIEIINHLKSTNQAILIVGHTDSVGSDRYNQALSELRAREIYKFFIKNGIDKNRLDYIGYGEEQPIATNATSEGRAKNRRVELLVSKDLNISSKFLKNRNINKSYWNNHSVKEAGTITKTQKGWSKNLNELQINNMLVKLKKPVREEFHINLKKRVISINSK
jgi:outer membrane protein OmpA-like peptidoglycan-associated protein